MNGMNREDPVLATYWSLPDSLWYPSIRSVYWSGVDISNGTSRLFRALATANGGVPAMFDDLVAMLERCLHLLFAPSILSTKRLCRIHSVACLSGACKTPWTTSEWSQTKEMQMKLLGPSGHPDIFPSTTISPKANAAYRISWIPSRQIPLLLAGSCWFRCGNLQCLAD